MHFIKKVVKDVILVAKHESMANTEVVNMQRASTMFIIYIIHKSNGSEAAVLYVLIPRLC